MMNNYKFVLLLSFVVMLLNPRSIYREIFIESLDHHNSSTLIISWNLQNLILPEEEVGYSSLWNRSDKSLCSNVYSGKMARQRDFHLRAKSLWAKKKNRVNYLLITCQLTHWTMKRFELKTAMICQVLSQLPYIDAIYLQEIRSLRALEYFFQLCRSKNDTSIFSLGDDHDWGRVISHCRDRRGMGVAIIWNKKRFKVQKTTEDCGNNPLRGRGAIEQVIVLKKKEQTFKINLKNIHAPSLLSSKIKRQKFFLRIYNNLENDFKEVRGGQLIGSLFIGDWNQGIRERNKHLKQLKKTALLKKNRQLSAVFQNEKFIQNSKTYNIQFKKSGGPADGSLFDEVRGVVHKDLLNLNQFVFYTGSLFHSVYSKQIRPKKIMKKRLALKKTIPWAKNDRQAAGVSDHVPVVLVLKI